MFNLEHGEDIFPREDIVLKILGRKDFFVWEYYGRHLTGRLHSWFKRKRYRIIVDFLIKAGVKNQKVLDVGCGPMFISHALIKRFDVDYIGIDILPAKELRQYKRVITLCNGKSIDVVRASAEKCPFKDNVFNSSLLLSVLEHIKKPRDVMKEVTRVNKNGGLIIVTLPLGNLFHKLVRTGFIFRGKMHAYMHSLRKKDKHDYIGDIPSYEKMSKYIEKTWKKTALKYSPLGSIKAINISAICFLFLEKARA